MKKPIKNIEIIFYLICGIYSLITVIIILFFLNYEGATLKNRQELLNFETNKKFYKKSNKNNWHRIDVGIFSIELPKEYKYQKIKTIDTFSGNLINSNNKGYSFAYGMYDLGLERYMNSDYTISIDTLSGYNTMVVIPKDKIGTSGIFIYNVDYPNNLIIRGNTLPLEDAVYALKSIKIPNDNNSAYTSKNFGYNIPKSPIKFSGKTIFNNNCLQCHGFHQLKVSKVSVKMMAKRNSEYLKEMLYVSKIKVDDIEFNHDFSSLSENEINSIVMFISSHN